MTASLSDSAESEGARLPLWRLVSGVALLGILVALVVIAGLVYLNNFRLDRYMRALAEQPSSAQVSDAALTESIVDRARQLDLPIQASGVRITRAGGKPHIQIDRYVVHTAIGRMDLRISDAASR